MKSKKIISVDCLLRLPPFYATLKKYHLEHHFADYNNGFGVTSPFWDWVFGTQLLLPDPKTLKTQ